MAYGIYPDTRQDTNSDGMLKIFRETVLPHKCIGSVDTSK